MAKAVVPHFQNDAGVSHILIGVKEFMCVGAKSPHDHPHVYLDMGDGAEKVCPYCATLFKYDSNLKTNESTPSGCLLEGESV